MCTHLRALSTYLIAHETELKRQVEISERKRGRCRLCLGTGKGVFWFVGNFHLAA